MVGQVLASTPGSTGVEELLQLLLSDEHSVELQHVHTPDAVEVQWRCVCSLVGHNSCDSLSHVCRW